MQRCDEIMLYEDSWGTERVSISKTEVHVVDPSTNPLRAR
jgi:hypothetical protein